MRRHQRVDLTCSGCGTRSSLEANGAGGPWPGCATCGAVPERLADGAADRVTLGACLVCGESRLYRQKDLDRRVGLAVVAAGAAVSLAILPWSPPAAYAVLAGLAVVDLVLYRRLPEVVICYRCKAEHRGFPAPDATPFDLLTAEMVDHDERRRRGMDTGRASGGGSGPAVAP